MGKGKEMGYGISKETDSCATQPCRGKPCLEAFRVRVLLGSLKGRV